MNNDAQHHAAIAHGDNPCHSRLSGVAKQDSFLGQPDQRPTLDQALILLAQRLAEHEQQIAARFQKIRDEIEKNIREVSQTLQATRVQLEKDLAPLSSTSPPAADILRQLDDRLDHLVLRLSRRFRTRLQCALDPAAPERKIMPAVMKELDQFRREAVETLPEEFLLLHTRQPDAPFEPGKSIFELAVMPQLPRLCRSRLLARWRLSRLRKRLKRSYRLLPLPFQEMTAHALILRSSLAATALIERHEKTHEELKNRLTDHWRAIRYNLDNAVVDLEDMLEEIQAPRKTEAEDKRGRRTEIGPLVLAAFDQSLESLEEITTTLVTVQESILAEIRQDHENALHTIREGVEKSGSLQGRLRWGYKTLLKSLKRSLSKTAERLDKGWGRIAEFLHRLSQRLLHVYFGVRRFFGLKVDIEETQLRLTDLPLTSEVTERARDLPPIYRRLYSSDPLVNREFLVSREEETVELENALKRWKSGRPASVAIVGPEGSGKTSLLNCLENDLDSGITVSHLSIFDRPRTVKALCWTIARGLEMSQQPETVDELIVELQGLTRRIIIVERAHHLMMRAVGGRQVTEAFLRMMMATNDHFLWLVSLRQYPWQRLEYLFNARRYFTYVIPCVFHDENELKEALLRRERVTGHELLYVEGEKPSAQVRKLLLTHSLESPAVQKALAEEYFSTLYDVSGGNMRAALYFWLQSLTRDGSGRIRVHPCIQIDDSFIRNLERNYHFTLAEVVGHGTLSVDEHSEIFRLNETQSRLQLDYLLKIRLLEIAHSETAAEETRYEINPVFHKPISRTLLNLNVLY